MPDITDNLEEQNRNKKPKQKLVISEKSEARKAEKQKTLSNALKQNLARRKEYSREKNLKDKS